MRRLRTASESSQLLVPYWVPENWTRRKTETATPWPYVESFVYTHIGGVHSLQMGTFSQPGFSWPRWYVFVLYTLSNWGRLPNWGGLPNWGRLPNRWPFCPLVDSRVPGLNVYTPLLIFMHEVRHNANSKRGDGRSHCKWWGTCAHSLILGKNYDVMHKYWVRSFSFPGSTPMCGGFFPRTNVGNYLHTFVLEKKTPHTGVDPGKLNERTH